MIQGAGRNFPLIEPRLGFGFIGKLRSQLSRLFQGEKSAEEVAYETETITLAEAEYVIPNDCVFVSDSGNKLDVLKHQMARDEEFIACFEAVAASLGKPVSHEDAQKWILSQLYVDFQTEYGVSEMQMEVLVYRELLRRYPNILWLRGSSFGKQNELYGCVGDFSLPLSAVLSEKIRGVARKEPVLMAIPLTAILDAYEQKLISLTGMSDRGAELRLELRAPVGSTAYTEYLEWLDTHLVSIRPSVDEDFETAAQEFFMRKGIHKNHHMVY